MRRYDDPVEVRRGVVGEPALEAPEQFLWHGRLWKVREVVAHWVETGAWWQSSGVRAVIGSDDPAEREVVTDLRAGGRGADLLGEREFWRVEAGVGPSSSGVFDLAFDWADGNWQLVGCVD
ncbi:conserved hypothetical protein [metagenome]|uniref:DUF6504 domain-containing protein n=1 Tax=metagenome TaxID=256318 RepID=A0A2P2BW91_9ZZZZ